MNEQIVTDKIFLPVDGIGIRDLYDWSNVLTKQPPNLDVGKKGELEKRGSKISTNEEEIAVFRFKNEVFAIASSCPHAGGPLHLGEIEELPDRTMCVRCPWHGWKFNVKTGELVEPSRNIKNPKYQNVRLKTYPVNLNYDSDKISIGFDGINSNYFKSTNF